MFRLTRARTPWPLLLWCGLLLGCASQAAETPRPSNRDLLTTALSAPGKTQLDLPVESAAASTVIPVTVIRGAGTGPTLLALAGVHGSEFTAIVANQRLARSLRPADLQGNVILVHMANLPAFMGRSIYTSPVDGKNLNRLFPGKADGTLTERIAFTITSDLYPFADAVLDMHAGDGNEDLRPSWVGFYGRAGKADVIKRSRAMALAFGIEHIVEFLWEFDDPAEAIWGGSAAIARDIPSIDVEAGGRGELVPEAIAEVETGVRRLLAHMGISNERFDAPPEPIIIRERSSIKAPQDGSWTPLKAAGERVTKGERLGYLSDFHGRHQFDALAPSDGLLLLILTTPPVHEGETLAQIARLPGKTPSDE